MKLDAKKYPTLAGIVKAASSGTEYKLRAECLADVQALMQKIKFSEYKVINVFPPDVELEFKTDLPLEEIKTVLKSIPDSHVMLETLALKTDYTGERIQESQ